ncbi:MULTISPECIES: hypothetical protein [Bacillaceae]|uniref:hypothetical protein n=1 Tax=Bacillaceae TaxID=186817 RepID=UPI00077C28CF|nr:hypothetical protein [Priestia flexa]MED4587480.1 hypothetical protein [Priestia flexa]
MGLILEYNWELFILIELLSIGALILFGIFRYFFNKPRLSIMFIFLFLFMVILEGLLGLYVYHQTGEISTFQIVITVFIIYAFTFGIFDFIRLDRWMRRKIGTLRGVELLSDKDYKIIERNNNPKYIAKKYRKSSYIHLFIFVTVQAILWIIGTESIAEIKMYLSDFSWIEKGVAKESPYPNDVTFGIGIIWGIVFIADFIYSWSYTLFPK